MRQIVQEVFPIVKNTGSIIVRYLLWGVTTVVTIYSIFIVRDLYLAALAVANVSHWSMGAIDKFSLVALGVIALGMIIWFQDRIMRFGTAAFLTVIAWQLMSITGMQLLRSVLINTRVPGVLTSMDGAIFLVAVLLGIGLLKLRPRFPAPPQKRGQLF